MIDQYPKLCADMEGIWREDRPGARYGLAWPEIYRIVAYKLDCVTETDIVLEVDFEFGEYLELNDKWEGFEQVVSEISERLPGIPAAWFAAVDRASPGAEPVVVWKSSRSADDRK